MLALVDGVPAHAATWTQFIRLLRRRTRSRSSSGAPAYRLRKAEERAHILRGLVKALDLLDEVIALIRRQRVGRGRPRRPDGAARHRRDPGHRDPGHAAAPAGRPGAAADHRRAGRDRGSRSPTSRTILASPERQRQIIPDELAEIVEKYGDDRRTQIVAVRRRRVDGGPHRARRTSSSPSPAPATRSAPRPTSTGRSGAAARACRAPQLKQDDIVDHFFVCSTHDWILFFTNKGRVYRAKAYELPEASRTARGQHVANLLAFQPDEQIAQVIADQGLRGRAVPGAGHQARAWSRRPG